MPAVHDPFASTLSLAVHELRTPVTVVTGYLRMLLKEQGGPLTEKQTKMLEEAEQSCKRITALVSDMSEVATFEAGEVSISRQDVDVAALLTSAASDMHEGEDRGVRLELRGADRPLVISGDRARLAAALTTLLRAALRERGQPGVVVAQCATGGDASSQVVITIGDDSPPADEILAHGLPFDEYRGGMGLALPIARRTIAAHGGAIWNVSEARPRAGCVLQLPLKK